MRDEKEGKTCIISKSLPQMIQDENGQLGVYSVSANVLELNLLLVLPCIEPTSCKVTTVLNLTRN